MTGVQTCALPILDGWSSGRGYVKGPVPGPRRHDISDAVPRRTMRPIIDFDERNNLARVRILHHEIDDLLREGIAVRWRGSLAGPRGRLEKGAHRHLGVKARSEEHTSELQSLMRISYAVFCLK